MNIWEAIDRAHNNLQLLEDLIIKNPITDLDQIKDGLTAIMWASKLGHAGIVKSLFDLGANVNQRNNHGITPLMLAAENNHKKVLKLLIEDGAKINLKNNKGQDALAFARETGNADIEKLLIEYEAKDNLKVKKQKDIHAVTHTVTQTSVLKETHKPIENAKLKSKKENGEQKHIEKLEPKHVPKHTVALKNKKGKGKRKSTKTNTTKPLEKFIIDVNKGEDKKKKHPSIWEAIDQANDDPQVLGELIKKHNILNFDELRNGETPLIYSIKQNHVKSAGSLIKHGANINLRDKNGKTPLMWSVMFNNIDTATSLIEHKADINLQDNEGYTALMFTNDLDITKLLIANGADVPLKNKKGQDALTTFKQDNEGYTSHCITNKDLDIAKLLIANGADVPLKIKNNNSLDNIGDYLLEQIGVAYRKTLKDILADPEMQFLKIPKDLENHQQILLEIVHTLLSRFESKAKMMEYFKHKKKQSDTDYQVPIKSVVLESKNAEEALAELLRSREFSKDDMGRERVLVAQFPNLTKEEYNILVHKAFNIFLPTNKTPVLRAIHLPDEKCIIAFIQPPIEKILDLHGFSVKQAQQNALEYIMDQYFDFADGASLMVGRGTHSKIKSGLSPITAKTKKLLEDLKKDNFVESYKQLPDRFNIRFYPPVAISKNELLDAINFGYEGIAMNSLNRIILKLDKKYQPNELIRKSCLLATDVLRLCPTVQKIYLFTKEDVESDFLKFLFTYNNLEDIPITMSEKTQYKVAVIGGGTTEESVCVSGI